MYLLDAINDFIFNVPKPKTKQIKGKILDKMIYLIFKDQNKIKIIYEHKMKEKKELLQLTLDFNCYVKTKEESRLNSKNFIFNILMFKNL